MSWYISTTLLLVAPAQLLPKDHVQPGPESSCCAIRLDDLPGWILILSVWQLSKPLPPTSEEYQSRGRENPFNQHPRRRTLCRPVTLLLLAIYCLPLFLNIEGDIVFLFFFFNLAHWLKSWLIVRGVFQGGLKGYFWLAGWTDKKSLICNNSMTDRGMKVLSHKKHCCPGYQPTGFVVVVVFYCCCFFFFWQGELRCCHGLCLRKLRQI